MLWGARKLWLSIPMHFIMPLFKDKQAGRWLADGRKISSGRVAMEKNIIVAMTRRRVIGCHGALPWHIPEDLRLFRTLTSGHAVIMGRATFESIGRPLPERHNLVVSRTLRPSSGIVVCASLAAAMEHARRLQRALFFIGGREIYRQALPLADRLLISWIEQDYAGDCFFPPLDLSAWKQEWEREYPAFTHVGYRRRAAEEKA